MRKQKHKRPVGQNSPLAPKPNRVRWIVAGVVGVAAVVAVALFRPPSGPSTHAPPPPSAAAPAATTKDVGTERLVGRWLRPDGGYVLEIRRAEPDGRLDAAYSNPRSIHVARAEWRRESGNLKVFIELRDVNYPGSTYTLAFYPDQDRLAGAYFQAVERQTFDVMFVRQP